MGNDVNSSGDTGALVDRFYDALARGDLFGARACCTADVRFWHSFDRIALSLDEASHGWERLFAGFPERAFVDVRRCQTENGFVQQLIMVGTTPAGVRLGWPLCIIIAVRDGLIARLDEYIDRAGHFVVTDADLPTPG
jgi:ketosteroid isomerase-like protein